MGEKVELFHQVEAEPVIMDGILRYDFPKGIPENQLYGCVNSRIPDLVLYVDGEYRCNYASWLSYRIFDIGMMEREHGIALAGYYGSETRMGFFIIWTRKYLNRFWKD